MNNHLSVLHNKRVLLVDDSAALRKILVLRLRKFGAEVFEAADGQEAISKLQANPVDLIISDVDMPEMDGLALAQRLKNDPATRQLPIILLSMLDSTADLERGYQAGATTYLSKSVDDEELLKNIEEVFARVQRQRESLVLVVDDSLTMLKLVETGLAKAGFNVLTAKNGAEALDLLAQHQPDIIVSDLDMPVMNGQEFLTQVLRSPTWSQIPFMIMSANSEKSIMRELVHKGAASYMVKPFNIDQFIMTVERLLSEQFRLLLKERERLELERTSMLSTITSLIQALEARDKYTSGHSKRVAAYSVSIAEHMGLSEEEIDTLRIGGKLHDVGKIGVPDSLLLKPGKLTDEEISQFRWHPSIGADILKPIASLGPMIDVVLYHHERPDGLGYPNGLKGDEIPLLARICGVADCFDALTSDRPYRKGFQQEKAYEIIREVRGTQLCPICVDAFFDGAVERIDDHQEDT
ncbi:MAG: response regulator [bacterium]|nr:response regulator [bacterium]